MIVIELVVFLGNPGRQYSGTRHNFAWSLADALPEIKELPWHEKFSGLIAERSDGAGVCRFLLPGTYMNGSGKSVYAASDFFRVKPGNLLVVHDDLELAFGSFAWRSGGGLAGHNGLKSIRDSLGTPDFFRLRLGIGRPLRGTVHSWVLGRFGPDEEAVLPLILSAAANSLKALLEKRDTVQIAAETVRVYP
jgi:PTH1 family peptidyl-tRNA hydrolase